MSDLARAHQECITGHPSTEGYLVNGVKFDDFMSPELIDVKGPNHMHFVNNGRFYDWFDPDEKILT